MAQGLFGEAVDRIGGEPIASRMARRAPVRHVDPVLIVVALLLATFGALMVYSATLHDQVAAGLDPDYYLKRQIGYAVAGVIIMFLVNLFDYRHLKGFAPVIYGITLLALVVVLTPLGTVQKGASRWIDLGPIQLQPSEIAKIAVILTAAAYLSLRKGEPLRLRDVVVTGLIVLAPAGLVYLEPDLGTMLVLMAVTAALLWVGGGKLRHFLLIGILAVVTVLVVIQAGLLQQYQIDRLTSFMNPHPDPRSSGYNLVQSKIAIGSGGLHGKGFARENTQTSLDFVPEQHTDFIFTAVGEQLGFVGAATLLALFGLLIWRGLRIATMSRDLFGTLLASGVVAFWAFQMFVNIGMTMGIMPITGIPLPFISYGGSSLLTNFIAVGLLLNVHMRRYLAP
jgi:rod shape determining protein RodA